MRTIERKRRSRKIPIVRGRAVWAAAALGLFASLIMSCGPSENKASTGGLKAQPSATGTGTVVIRGTIN